MTGPDQPPEPTEPDPQIGRPPAVPGQFQSVAAQQAAGYRGSHAAPLQPGEQQPGPYTPGQNPPGPYAPGQYGPEAQYGPAQYGPGQYAPGQYAPGQYAPGQYAPGQFGPQAQYGPGQHGPGQSAQGQHAQGQHASAQSAPGQSAPGQSAPGQSAPGQAAPAGYPPGQYAPPPGPAQPTPVPGTAAPAAPAPSQAYTMTRSATQAAVGTAGATIVAPGQSAEALALPEPGRFRPPGSPPDLRRPGTNRGARGLTGRLARLRIGSHTVSRPALAQLRVGTIGAGLILGADRHQAPVSVRVFRPEPTRVTLVGGAWAGRLVAFRAFAVGARIAVITAEPQAWQEFGFRATGSRDRVLVIGAQQPLAFAGTAQQPVLVIDEFGAGTASPQALGPWQTQLTVVRQLDPAGVSLVQECDLVMLQRLRGDEAVVAGRALRLSGASTQFLQVMADDMVALVADGADRYISFAQTDMEREYTGGARR